MPDIKIDCAQTINDRTCPGTPIVVGCPKENTWIGLIPPLSYEIAGKIVARGVISIQPKHRKIGQIGRRPRCVEITVRILTDLMLIEVPPTHQILGVGYDISINHDHIPSTCGDILVVSPSGSRDRNENSLRFLGCIKVEGISGAGILSKIFKRRPHYR